MVCLFSVRLSTHMRILPFFFLAMKIAEANGFRDPFIMPAASSSWRCRCTSMSAGVKRQDLSLNGQASFSRIWCSTPLASPTSHSGREKMVPRSASFWLSLFFQSSEMGESPKLKRFGSRKVVFSSSGCATVTISLTYILCEQEQYPQEGRFLLRTRSAIKQGTYSHPLVKKEVQRTALTYQLAGQES